MVVEWAAAASAASLRKIKVAFLVAPVDPRSPAFPAAAASFASVRESPLPFPGLLVASGNDPYSTLACCRTYARNWGTGFVDVGERGHINSTSGLGAWPQGRELLESLLHG